MVLPLLALAPVVMQVAPFLADLLFGERAGQVTEKVAGLAQQVLGTSDPDGVQAAMRANPERAMAFQEALARMAADERQAQRLADLETLRAQLADVQNARQQTVDLAKIGNPIAYGAVIISALVMGAFIWAMQMVFAHEVPAIQRDLVMVMLGALTGSVTAAGALRDALPYTAGTAPTGNFWGFGFLNGGVTATFDNFLVEDAPAASAVWANCANV